MIDCVPDTTHRVLDEGIHYAYVVSFTAAIDLSGKKEELLSRDTTKHRVIPMISDKLRETG